MGKSGSTQENGPDYLDTWNYIRVIEDTHKVTIAFGLMPTSKTSRGAFQVFLDAAWPDLASPGMVSHVTVKLGFPSPAGRSFWSIAYALCAKLDFELSRSRYKQDSIWLEE
jgi:hypothetical protein